MIAYAIRAIRYTCLPRKRTEKHLHVLEEFDVDANDVRAHAE